MLIQNLHITIQKVTRTIKAKIEAKLGQDLLLQVLNVLSRERALLRANQIIVSKDHVLIVWQLRLFELGSNQKAGAGEQVHVSRFVVLWSNACKESIHNAYTLK